MLSRILAGGRPLAEKSQLMVSPNWLLVIYCALLLLVSLSGGWLMLFLRPTHARLQIAISFVGGLMLGISLLHFLPDSIEHLNSVDKAVHWLLAGFLTMFFLQRILHFHHHDFEDDELESCCADVVPHSHQPHTPMKRSAGQLSWLGTALGMTLHSLLDGLALAAAVEAGSHGFHKLAGWGVALVVILHKPFDAIAISALMTTSGRSRVSQHVLNGLFALTTPIGALLFYLGVGELGVSGTVFLGEALAFCSGTFLCIAGSDLLPELHFHSHDRLKLSLALLLGLALAVAIKQFEVV